MKILITTICAIVACVSAVAQTNEAYINDLPGESDSKPGIHNGSGINPIKIPTSIFNNIQASFTIPVLLYPLQSKRGKLDLVMANPKSVYEIMIIDARGNLVRYYSRFNGPKLEVERLQKGSYLISIKNLDTKKLFTEKLIVKE